MTSTVEASPEAAVREWLATYGAPDAEAYSLLCGRHPREALAFTVVEADLSSRDLTFGELDLVSGRLAVGLAGLGVSAGDRVATLMGRSVDLVTTLLALWRLGAVHVPLFTAFAPPAIALRVRGSGAGVIIVDPEQRPKLDHLTVDGPPLVVVTAGAATGTNVALADLAAAPADPPEPVAVGGDGVLIELFTSGTTGTPKAVPVPLRSLAWMHSYQTYGLGHRDDDVFWNAADPGWAFGLYCAVLAPMATGRRSLLLRSGFSVPLTWEVLTRYGVTNFAAGPTVYRALRASDVPAGVVLQRCSSAGEPLTPEIISWATEALGTPVRDQYGQTETGMTVANAWHPDLVAEIAPGSMGRVLPGWTIDVLHPEHDTPVGPGEQGRVAIDLGASPLMVFAGYRDAPERTAERFTADGRWYLTGDAATRDEQGRLYFASRDDDVILMAGYRIGPFEVESVLAGHAAVLEAAVVGEPDELRGEVVVAYVVVAAGTEVGEAFTAELQQLVRTGLAAHVYPRRVYVVDALPRTPSGKVQRYLLRQEPSTGEDSDR